nr:unnamed protein product [Digitaria exilis]
MATASAAPLASLLLASILLLLGAPALSSGGGCGGEAHPGYSSGGEGTCTVDAGAAALTPATRERGGAGGGRRIIDITHAYVADLPTFATGEVAGPVVRLKQSMAEGSEYNLSELKMECHTGTHVDAPGHINQANFAAGLDVDTLDLDVLNDPSATCRSSAWSCTPGHMIQEHFEVGLDADTLDLVALNGPALLVDVPRDTNITAQAMEYLQIPKGVSRVLFRTLNTDRKLMWKKGGDFSYVGFTEDGAQWLVDNTDIKLIGVDYLSVAAYDHLISAHVVFFKNPEIIPVEGLKLDDVEAGLYNLHCLPLRLVGAEGSPIRCILIK